MKRLKLDASLSQKAHPPLRCIAVSLLKSRTLKEDYPFVTPSSSCAHFTKYTPSVLLCQVLFLSYLYLFEVKYIFLYKYAL
jgi:hypothetical protein